ncbi:myosin light chain kinase 3 [Engraulis encrasicolus]|uniref:myosin light chain kinase 3 n=1 Tax=Engraulis encrasicolus TaxID=184585 RepID=UPI002FD727D7
MSKPATLTSCIAKMYDGGKLDNGATPLPAVLVKKPSSNNMLSSLGAVELKLGLLEGKVEQLAHGQAEVLRRLDTICAGLGALERDVAQLKKQEQDVALLKKQEQELEPSKKQEVPSGGNGGGVGGVGGGTTATVNHQGLTKFRRASFGPFGAPAVGVCTAPAPVTTTPAASTTTAESAAMLAEVRALCGETVALLKGVQDEGRCQRVKMEGIASSVSAVDKALGYLGELFRSSKIVEFILKGIVPWGRPQQQEPQEQREERDRVEEEVVESQMLQEPQDRAEEVKQRDPQEQERPEEVEDKKQDTEGEKTKPEDGGVTPQPDMCDQATQVQEDIQESLPDELQQGEKGQGALGLDASVASPELDTEGKGHSETAREEGVADQSQHLNAVDASGKAQRRPKEVTPRSREPTRVQTFAPEPLPHVMAVKTAAASTAAIRATVPAKEESAKEEVDITRDSTDVVVATVVPPQPSQEEKLLKSEGERLTTLPKLQGQEAISQEIAEPCLKDDQTAESTATLPESESNKVQNRTLSAEKVQDKPQLATATASETKATSPSPPPPLKNVFLLRKDSDAHFVVVDDCPPMPAPFTHRIVSAKQVPMGSYYSVKPNELLGGGRFGQVHKCAELSSGLTLAAKIIKVRGMKERDEVKNEIGVMNQLNHVNLIQLYDAFESRTNLTLIMEYVEGGELFNRIVDDNCQLTELDAIIFTRQICEGVQYLHQQYILHLDLKPENILCVTNTGNQIKIIDFGLARKYRPREKLKVNFGTPEFLAPEVVNYDFVSFPTDMWSVGVITYMLLSGLSPFLGENDAETMNNILHANWDFDSEAFDGVSEEAKDFVSRLLIPAKCGRLSATGCMKHSWLNNLGEKARKHCVQLKSQMHLQRYMAIHRQWKKHFYVVAAANRLQKFQKNRSSNPA